MNCAINSMGNLLSLDIFENEVHSEEDIIPENSNSLIEQYAFQVLDFSSQYGYEIFFFGSIDLKKKNRFSTDILAWKVVLGVLVKTM